MDNINKTIAYGVKYNFDFAQKDFRICLFSDTETGLWSRLFNRNIKMVLSFSKNEEFNYVLELLRKRQLIDNPY